MKKWICRWVAVLLIFVSIITVTLSAGCAENNDDTIEITDMSGTVVEIPRSLNILLIVIGDLTLKRTHNSFKVFFSSIYNLLRSSVETDNTIFFAINYHLLCNIYENGTKITASGKHKFHLRGCPEDDTITVEMASSDADALAAK